jgi:membrane protein DedA with SNARE-associated domain
VHPVPVARQAGEVEESPPVTADDELPAVSADDTRPTAAPIRHRGAPSRRALTFVVVPLIALVVASWVGDALAPTLAVEHPLVLLVLSPRMRNQVLVVNQIPVLVFFAVATLRLLAADPPFFFLGRWYGDSAVAWVARQSPRTAELVTGSERTWRGVLYPLVAIAPNNVVCLLAGSMGMRPLVFMVLNVAGTLGRLTLIVLFGAAFEEQINWVLELIGEYRWWLVALSTLVVAIFAWRGARAGGGELGQLRRLGKDLADDESDGESGTRSDADAGTGTASEDERPTS